MSPEIYNDDDLKRILLMSKDPDFMKLDPNLVPYREEWNDGLGGMANAIFWLDKHWNSTLNAQGDRMMPDGSRHVWVYSKATGMLMVYNCQGTSWEITLDKMVITQNGNNKLESIYRPFLRHPEVTKSMANDGAPDPETGIPNVSWLRTRWVEFHRAHYSLQQTPLYVHGAVKNLEATIGKGKLFWGPLDLTFLLPAINLIPSYTRVSPEQHNCLQALYADIKRARAGFPMQEQMVSHYRSLLLRLWEFYLLVQGIEQAIPGWPFSEEAHRHVFEATIVQMIEDLKNLAREAPTDGSEHGAIDVTILEHVAALLHAAWFDTTFSAALAIVQQQQSCQ